MRGSRPADETVSAREIQCVTRAELHTWVDSHPKPRSAGTAVRLRGIIDDPVDPPHRLGSGRPSGRAKSTTPSGKTVAERSDQYHSDVEFLAALDARSGSPDAWGARVAPPRPAERVPEQQLRLRAILEQLIAGLRRGTFRPARPATCPGLSRAGVLASADIERARMPRVPVWYPRRPKERSLGSLPDAETPTNPDDPANGASETRTRDLLGAIQALNVQHA
jgi:hypothetical protein